MAKRKPKRRANDLGGLHWRESRKRWEATITVASEVVGHDEDGRPKYRQRRRTVTGATQEEALAKLDALREELAAEQLGHVPPTATLARYLGSWFADVLPGSDLAPTTRDQYERIGRLYIIPTIGNVKLEDLKPPTVRRMLSTLTDQGLSPATARQARSVLSAALQQAVFDGLIATNPVRGVRSPRQTNTGGRTLTPDEARTLLSAAQGHEYEALVYVLLSLGLRRGEALGLSWADVDLDSAAPKLTVRRALKRDAKDRTYLDEPKTARSRRTIHLPASLVDVLRRHRARQAEQRLAFGEGWGGRWADEDLVFTTSIGTALDPRRVTRTVEAIAVDAGLGKWTPHELRHSAASLLLAQNVPLKVVSELLGHSSIRVTADVYGHLLDDARAEAATAMESVLRS